MRSPSPSQKLCSTRFRFDHRRGHSCPDRRFPWMSGGRKKGRSRGLLRGRPECPRWRPARADGDPRGLVDALGTLLELEPPWTRLAGSLGAPVDERLVAAVQAEMAYYRDHSHEGRDAASLAALRERCAAVLSRELGREVDVETLMDAIRFRAFPDAVPALEALRKRGLKLVCVSNWDCALSEVLERTGLGGRLDGVVTSAGAGARKPDPAIFAVALELAGCARRRGAARRRHAGRGRRRGCGGRDRGAAARPRAAAATSPRSRRSRTIWPSSAPPAAPVVAVRGRWRGRSATTRASAGACSPWGRQVLVGLSRRSSRCGPRA